MLQAGSLSGNLPKWREFTSDPWILQTVSGYHLEFETTPHQVNLPKFPKFTKRETALIESEIKKLVSKGAVTEVPLLVMMNSFLQSFLFLRRPVTFGQL